MGITAQIVTVIVIFCFFEFGLCANRYSGRDRILLFNNDIFFGASKMPNRYNFRYLTDGRQYREEAGYTVRRGAESIMKVRGKFYYTGDDGRVYETVYEADENGYRPVSRIVGGVKYPYPERFPAPLPDIPLRADDDDLSDLTPFGTEYGSRTPNRGQTRQRPRPTPRPSPKPTSTTTPSPEEDEDDQKQNQYGDEGEDNFDYPIGGGAGGEKRDTKNQDNDAQATKEQQNNKSVETDSYSSPSESPPESTDLNDPEIPATDYQPPPKNEFKPPQRNKNKPPRRKPDPQRKTQSVTVDRSDEFLDSLFGS